MLAALALAAAATTWSPPAFASPRDQAAVAYAQPVIALVHAEVVDGTGAAPQHDTTLVIDRGRIAALGPSAKVSPPAGAEVIDATGKTLLPGFVMVHEHMFYTAPGGPQYGEYPFSMSRLYLAGGETTIRTGGSMAVLGDLNTRDRIAAGKDPGPDIDVTGPYFDGPGIYTVKMQALKDPADAKRTVDYWAAEGVTSFKAYMNIPRAELKAAIDAAHAHGIKVTGHLCAVTYREAAAMGIDNLEHGFIVATDFTAGKSPDVCPKDGGSAGLARLDPEGPEATALIKDLIAHKVALTSTLTVFESTVKGRPKAPEGALALLASEWRESYEKTWARMQALSDADAAEEAADYAHGARLEKRFADMGGTLLAGTDPTGYGGIVPGFSGKREIELLVEEGFTFPQALKIATLNGATYLGREREVGSLEVGKRADVVVVEGDPAADPRAIERMPLVFKAGVGYRTQAIFDRLKGAIGLY